MENNYLDGFRDGYKASRGDIKAQSSEEFFHPDSYRAGYHTALKDVRDGAVRLGE